MYVTTKSALSGLARRAGRARGRGAMTGLLAAVCLLPLAFAPAAHADPIVYSTFEADADGWNAVTLNASNAVTGTHAVTWNAAGGNPDGHISRTDPNSDLLLFNAPAKFLGDKSAAYNGTLTFDLRRTAGTHSNAADVMLVGGDSSLTLVYDAAALLTTNWTSFVVPFNAGQWRVGSLTGAYATPQQVLEVLAALTALRIRGEFINGFNETGRLDNVSVNAPPEPTPEPAALALMGTGLAGCAIIARRRHRQNRRRRRARDCRHAYVEPAGLSI